MTIKINPYKTKLDQGNAYWMARIAQEVYQKTSEDNQFPDEQKILANLKAEDEKFISVTGADKNSAQGAIVEHEEYICIAFRGTNEVVDWLDNINAFSTKQLFGDFHRGFWNSVEDVWPVLSTKLDLLQKVKKRPLFFTGHSLGGAMATIAAARFVHEDLPFTGVYTFGQPRTMNKETALIFNTECKERYFRFHNNNDIVTRVPARLMGYSHVGTYLYISEEQEIHRESGFWFRFVDAMDGVVASVLDEKPGFDVIRDHDMKDYLAGVCKWDLKD